MKISYHYKPADVACEYCVNSRRRRCRESGCPWLAERIEAGVVSYASAVRELFGGITDETFVVSSLHSGILKASYMLGLITMPILGWNLGTWLGGAISAVLPQALQNAMGIALYAMFIALILPAARKSRSVCCVIILAVVMVCILKYVPVFAGISSGFRVILVTIAASAFGAWKFPHDPDGKEAGQDESQKEGAE